MLCLRQREPGKRRGLGGKLTVESTIENPMGSLRVNLTQCRWQEIRSRVRLSTDSKRMRRFHAE